MKEVTLSTDGLKGPASLGIRDFAFIIGGTRFECNQFEACFLSPRVTELLTHDSTICEYEIDNSNFDNSIDFTSVSFEEILSLSRGSHFCVNGTNLLFAKSVFKNLGNRELCNQLISFELGDVSLSLSNVFERLAVLKFFECCYSNEIAYLSSNFYHLDAKLLATLDLCDFELVLSNDSLQLQDEDSLLSFILSLGSSGHCFIHHIRSEYLSISGINLFLNSISLEDLNNAIWLSLCHRLRSSNPISRYPTSRYATRSFVFNSGHPFDGILSHFTKESGGNVHTTGIIVITASGTGRNQCHQVADHNWNDYWHSKNVESSWIQFDFQTRSVSLTNYTIKSDGESGCHLLHWSVDGSNDLVSWVNLDRQDTYELNGPYVVKSYSCLSGESSRSFFRYLRLTQRGKNSSNDHYLQLGNLEFFGTVRLG
jgi:hypothetical protein